MPFPDVNDNDKNLALLERKIALATEGFTTFKFCGLILKDRDRSLINEIVELIRIGDIRQRISGGELLALFRSVGLNVRVSTSIRIEDHGKLVSLSDKLKQGNEGIPDGQ